MYLSSSSSSIYTAKKAAELLVGQFLPILNINFVAKQDTEIQAAIESVQFQ
jgi:hypothetical protein